MKNLKIGIKLLILVAGMIAGLLVASIFSFLFMSTINDYTTEIANNSIPSIVAAEEMNTALSDIRIQEYKHLIAHSTQDMDQVSSSLNEHFAEFNESYNVYVPLVMNDTDRKLLENIKISWDKYQSVSRQLLQSSSENKNNEARTILLGESLDIFNDLTGQCEELLQFNKRYSDQANRDADIAFSIAQKMTLLLFISITAAVIVFSIYMGRGITRPIREIDQVARKIADGQLNESIHYQSGDELGMLSANFNKTVIRLRDYVNYIDEISAVLEDVSNGNLGFQLSYDYGGEFAKIKMALIHISDSLNNTLTQINQSADQVASGSNQVASGSQALSQGAAEQASSIEELAAAIAEMSNQVSQNADNAVEASKIAFTVGEQIKSSNEYMQQMNAAMEDISNKSSQIGKINKTIEDIAFQTNILALNAAVEAARAGEAGKGFAVVADEVRNLASKSAEASKDTSILIEGSIQAVAKGTQIANTTASQLLKVVQGAETVVSNINSIAEVSQHQADSVNQVTSGVDQIASVIQTNSATAEESAAASEELSSQAQILRELVNRFQLKNNHQ